MLDYLQRLIYDQIIDKDSNKISIIESETQLYSYECGHYVVMFLYSFFKLLISEYQKQVYQNLLTKMITSSSSSSIYINDINEFNQELKEYIRLRCCEDKRRNFLNTLIAWIHEQRGF
jgi:hexokinase